VNVPRVVRANEPVEVEEVIARAPVVPFIINPPAAAYITEAPVPLRVIFSEVRVADTIRLFAVRLVDVVVAQ
jgi:hypothetical protein